MGKYRVLYYNRFACEDQTFNVTAKDGTDAERLFWLRYPKDSYGDCLGHILCVNEEHFYTEEEILSIIAKRKVDTHGLT